MEVPRRGYTLRCQKATKKTKFALLDEFIRPTGYHWKSAVRILSVQPGKEFLVLVDKKPVNLKPEKKRPVNRKGKRLYTDEVILPINFLPIPRTASGASAVSIRRTKAYTNFQNSSAT
jgi:hypothetical protein